MAKKQADVIQDVEEMNVDEVMSVYEEQGEPVGIPGLTAGRIVHYVFEDDTHRPAIITEVNDATTGNVNLIVFMDGQNDGYPGDNCIHWYRNTEYSEFNVLFTWHWIEADTISRRTYEEKYHKYLSGIEKA